MKKIILVLTSVLLLGISSCEEESFSRYPSLAIPQFSDSDYYALLSDKNPEVVYNAVVNLASRATELGRILSEKNADKNSQEYIMAEKNYRKIVELLKSRDANIVAVSLRFLQAFINSYRAKAELLEPVLEIKSNNSQVLYEQIITLKSIVNEDTHIADSVLRQFLNNPSWIVSHGTYLLIDALENGNLRQELIARYEATADEGEKLLMLTALGKQPSDIVADFFFSEILSTKSNKIRCAIYDILGNCRNQEKILTWVTQNYEKILTAGGNYLFQHYAASMEDNFSAKLLEIFLSNGFASDKNFLKALEEKLKEYTYEDKLENREKLDNLKMIEKALLTGKIMAADWESLRKEKEALNVKITALQIEYDALTNEFRAKVDKIFKKYGISEEKRTEYLSNVTDSRGIIKELFKPAEESVNQK